MAVRYVFGSSWYNLIIRLRRLMYTCGVFEVFPVKNSGTMSRSIWWMPFLSNHAEHDGRIVGWLLLKNWFILVSNEVEVPG